jgi:hypothetical protein
MEECYFEDQGGDWEVFYEGGMSMELVRYSDKWLALV